MSFRAKNPWFSWRYVSDNAETIRAALIEHLQFTGRAVLVATVIGIPLAVVAYWSKRLTGPILTSAGVLYTIPSLALFVFLVPFLGTSAATVVVGLIIYALLMIIRNTLTGLTQVPPDVREAATAMGYGRFARLIRVELPLALPSMMTGLRLATVSTVALVTVGDIIGRGGLGSLILAGFRNNFYKAQIATNTVLCVALALVLDLFLLGIGYLLAPWRRRRRA